MKIGIACGGTGGHIFPGMATAEILRDRGHEVTLWMGGNDIEKKALTGWTGAVITVQSTGLPPRPGLKHLNSLALNWRAFLECRRKMRFSPQEVLLAMGSYASFAPVMAARTLSIPVVLHEANVIPGRANIFLSRFARVFALGFEETRNHVRHGNMVYTGIPLRRLNVKDTSQDWKLLKPDVFTVLVMGGSRGARSLNEIAARAILNLHESGNAVQVIHLTGTDDEAHIRKTYLDAGVKHLVFAFLHNIDQAFQRASLALCRAGASTCAEIVKFGVPALLIPYPHAASNHQMANARALENAGAADVIEENKCRPGWLAGYIGAGIKDMARLQKMRQAAMNRTDKDAAVALAELVIETANKRT